MSGPTPALLARAGGRCELCGADHELAALPVPSPTGAPAAAEDRAVLACGTCRAQIAGDAPLDVDRWFCLQQAAWSEVPAVQVVSWRLLDRLKGEGWAQDLLDQLYLEDDVLAWARAGVAEAADEGPMRTVDSFGAVLADGDTVTLIKDLDVKGGGFTAKRGTVVKGIRLTDDPGLVEGRVNGVAIVLKTEFLKKAG